MSNLIQFESSDIRRIWDEETKQWFFAVVDVIEVLSQSKNPTNYWKAMKARSGDSELATICSEFPIKHKKNNRTYQTECANIEGLFRIIQSVPSPKAEPFKLWLARLGRERLEEVSDPAIAMERLKKMYLAMGHDPEWVNKRLLSISTSNDLIAEWEGRGVGEKSDHDLLMDVISKGAFDVTTAEHKAIKGLSEGDDLPDNMTSAELIFKMLGEISTTHIAMQEDRHGIDENLDASERGGRVAGNARRELELESGKSVVSSDNALGSGEDENNDPKDT